MSTPAISVPSGPTAQQQALQWAFLAAQVLPPMLAAYKSVQQTHTALALKPVEELIAESDALFDNISKTAAEEIAAAQAEIDSAQNPAPTSGS